MESHTILKLRFLQHEQTETHLPVVQDYPQHFVTNTHLYTCVDRNNKEQSFVSKETIPFIHLGGQKLNKEQSFVSKETIPCKGPDFELPALKFKVKRASHLHHWAP